LNALSPHGTMLCGVFSLAARSASVANERTSEAHSIA
jgi:hypothetical protein